MEIIPNHIYRGHNGRTRKALSREYVDGEVIIRYRSEQQAPQKAKLDDFLLWAAQDITDQTRTALAGGKAAS